MFSAITGYLILEPERLLKAECGRSVLGSQCLLTSITDIGANTAKTNSAIDSFKVWSIKPAIANAERTQTPYRVAHAAW